MKQPDWGMRTVVDEKNKPIWLANWRHVMSRQANFSTHEGACSWNILEQQICPWSLLPHTKPVWYEGAKLGSKSFVAQHIFSLEIVGADEGALLRERVGGACCGSKLPRVYRPLIPRDVNWVQHWVNRLRSSVFRGSFVTRYKWTIAITWSLVPNSF